MTDPHTSPSILPIPREADAAALPVKHQQFADVFSEEGARSLPAIDGPTHAIDIKGDAVPPHSRIYLLTEVELGVLREYLDNALAKGWIRPSKSPARALILFVPKKGGKLRLCVDYRALNSVTRKNRAPIPLIRRLSEARIYTKLDLREAYYRVRIKAGDE
jgi:hypothetical protein